VYVSDRRLVKCVNLLRVAAYCDGRLVVGDADLLLLQHVLWQRPGEERMIYNYVLQRLSEGEDNRVQIKYFLAALFGRACRLEAGDRQVLAERLRTVEEFESDAVESDATSSSDSTASATECTTSEVRGIGISLSSEEGRRERQGGRARENREP
jgi:hypothetical protein